MATTIRIYSHRYEAWVDITDLASNPITITQALDETMDSGAFTMPYVKADQLPHLNLGDPIEPYTRVEVTVDEELFRFFVESDQVSEVRKASGASPALFRHDVALIEPTKVLQRRVLPDMTITQAKLEPDEQVKIDETSSFTNSGATIPLNVEKILPDSWFTVTKPSNEPATIENRVAKINEQYKITYNVSIVKVPNPILAAWTLTLRIYAADPAVAPTTLTGSTLLETKVVNVSAGEVGPRVYVPSTGNASGVLEVTIPANKEVFISVQSANHSEYSLTGTITLETQVVYNDSIAYSYLDNVLEKILKITEQIKKSDTSLAPEFTLGSLTKSKINGVKSPELTFTKYTVWDAVKELADYRRAIPRLGRNDFTTIEFDFLDEFQGQSTLDLDVEEENKVESQSSEDYVTGLELNADNVIEKEELRNGKVEPYRTGWLTVRPSQDGPVQLTDDNATVKLEQRIYKVFSVTVRGLYAKLTRVGFPDIILDPNTTQKLFDITPYVLEEKAYKALPNSGDITTDCQGNHIYYRERSNRLLGLGFLAPEVPAIFSGTKKPALFELLFRLLQAEYPDYTIDKNYTFNDANITNTRNNLFRDIQFQVTYLPLAEVRASVPRSDSFEPRNKAKKYFNEQARLNDADKLGENALAVGNRLGNKLTRLELKANTIAELPRVGQTTPSGAVLTTRTISISSAGLDFSGDLYDDYRSLSQFVGVNSAFRQYNVPDDDTVFRQDVYEDDIIVSEKPLSRTGTTKSNPYTDNSLLRLAEGFRIYEDGFSSWGLTNEPFPPTYVRAQIKHASNDTVSATMDRPLSTLAIGNSTILMAEFENNWATGSKITKYVTSGNQYLFQNDSRYTNLLGNLDSIVYDVFRRGKAYTSATNFAESYEDANAYPDYTQAPDSGDRYSTVELRILKDARERIGYVQQLNFISDDTDTLRVYPGFAKYNGFMRFAVNDNILVKAYALETGYFPSVNDVRVDRSKIRPFNASSYDVSATSGTASILFGGQATGTGNVAGLVFIDDVSGELILAYKRTFAALTTISDTIYLVVNPRRPQGQGQMAFTQLPILDIDRYAYQRTSMFYAGQDVELFIPSDPRLATANPAYTSSIQIGAQSFTLASLGGLGKLITIPAASITQAPGSSITLTIAVAFQQVATPQLSQFLTENVLLRC
jgi:hypothetical protein